MAKCFCKVQNHAQCFTLNTSRSLPLLLPYQRPECCFKSKIFSCLDRDMTIFRDFQGPRPRRDIWHSETETLKNVSRDRDTSRDIQLCKPVQNRQNFGKIKNSQNYCSIFQLCCFDQISEEEWICCRPTICANWQHILYASTVCWVKVSSDVNVRLKLVSNLWFLVNKFDYEKLL